MGLNLLLVLAQHYLFAQRNQINSKLCSLRARPLSSIRIRLSPTLQLNTVRHRRHRSYLDGRLGMKIPPVGRINRSKITTGLDAF